MCVLIGPLAVPLYQFLLPRLTQLLRGVAIVFPGGSVRMVEVELSGSASCSLRRGKSFIFFEFAVACKWEGELVDDEGNVVGTGEEV